MKDIEISPMGNLSAGEYGKITIAGTCKASGNIKCSKIEVEGLLHGSAGISCTGKAKIDGRADCDLLTAEKIKVSGELKTKDSVKCKILSVEGIIIASGVEADEAEIEGRAEVSGLLNAEKITIRSSKSEIGSIGCAEIAVRYDDNHGGSESFFGLFKNIKGDEDCALMADSIEGDRIDLENTRCNIVRGAAVVIGKNCEIQEVEYTDFCTVDETATVKKMTKV